MTQMGVQRRFHAGGKREHLLLLLNGIIAVFLGYKVPQRGFCHKAEGDIGGVLQQQHIAGGGSQRIAGAVELPAVAVDQILDSAHQIGEGGAFIVGIAVAGGPGGQPQRTGKAVEAHVCRGSKDRHAVITVQRAVVERLRVGDLGSPERLTALPLRHLCQHSLHVLALTGIGGAGGQSDLRHAEGEAEDHFHGE